MARPSRGITFRVLVVVMALAVCLLALPAAATASDNVPSKYLITDVPLYQQIQAVGCGAASLQMVLDYWGPFINQKSVYDAARTFSGTSLPDMARAGQFSSLSFSAGDRYPAADGWGYPGRPLGYAGFYYAQATPWLDQLKAVVAQGYPVAVLTDWLPGVYGPHYRVIVGYDDTRGVIILNDPWARELKGDMDYQGSTNQNAAYDRQGEFAGWEWTYADFLSVWKLSTERWGVPGLAYGAALVAPWKVSVNAPAAVAPGKTFPLGVTATYSCAAPFATGGFPTFPASDATVELTLPAGFRTVSGSTTVSLGTMAAGQTKSVTVAVVAGAKAGSFTVGATASGSVSGDLGVWRDFPAYSYTDRIGGDGAVTVRIGKS
jgi:uncharacterized protein YvpB